MTEKQQVKTSDWQWIGAFMVGGIAAIVIGIGLFANPDEIMSGLNGVQRGYIMIAMGIGLIAFSSMYLRSVLKIRQSRVQG